MRIAVGILFCALMICVPLLAGCKADASSDRRTGSSRVTPSDAQIDPPTLPATRDHQPPVRTTEP